MTLCLDTSILIDLERKNPKTLNSVKEQIIFHPKPAKIAFISYFEMLYGIETKNVNLTSLLKCLLIDYSNATCVYIGFHILLQNM